MEHEYDRDEHNLQQYDEGYVPTGLPLRPEDLVPGEYSALIKSVKLDRVKTGMAAGDTVAKWMLVIIDGPASVRQTVEHTSWLNTPAKVSQFGGELLMLGIDTATWVPPDRSFSQMLPAALHNLAGAVVQFGVSTWMDKKSGNMKNQLRFSAASKGQRGGQDRDQMPDQSALPF